PFSFSRKRSEHDGCQSGDHNTNGSIRGLSTAARTTCRLSGTPHSVLACRSRGTPFGSNSGGVFMSADHTTTNAQHVPLGELERALLDEFIRVRGYDPEKLEDVPEAELDTLLKAASLYASGKLTEIESRLHFLDEVHGTVRGEQKSGLD